jgi:hypothetical protein
MEDSHTEKNRVSDIDHIANVIQTSAFTLSAIVQKFAKLKETLRLVGIESQAFSPGLTPLQT